ncbi:MAG: hypothetical protein BWK79_07295 [Beggiatoa sp. IS2]|nr:MAG: hypothetical protein BWK79_07295 [Beggiatoa sp. IS2]
MKQESPQLPPNSNNERLEQQGVYEMLWDCRYCGTVQLLGKTHRFCPGCGAPQDANARYFPTEEQKIAVHQHVYVGIDKICSACQSPNAGNAEFCGQCGAPLTDSARAKLQPFQPNQLSPVESPHLVNSLKDRFSLFSRHEIPLIIVIVIAILGGAGIMAVFWTKPATVIVTDHRWEREIKIEDFAPRAKSDWCNQIPNDSYNISRTSQVRSHKQIPDGEECSSRNVDQGDGTFRQEQVCRTKYRDEPIYDEHCSYIVNRWEYARSVKANNTDKNPIWPKFQLANQEREGPRLAAYYLHFEDHQAEKEYECAVDESLWQATERKSPWQIKIGVLTGGERCGTLQPLPVP